MMRNKVALLEKFDCFEGVEGVNYGARTQRGRGDNPMAVIGLSALHIVVVVVVVAIVVSVVVYVGRWRQQDDRSLIKIPQIPSRTRWPSGRSFVSACVNFASDSWFGLSIALLKLHRTDSSRSGAVQATRAQFVRAKLCARSHCAASFASLASASGCVCLFAPVFTLVSSISPSFPVLPCLTSPSRRPLFK